MTGVFKKNSYHISSKLTIITLIICIFIILGNDSNSTKVFSESFLRDSFGNFFKILAQNLKCEFELEKHVLFSMQTHENRTYA